jgi:hypothetical protein
MIMYASCWEIVMSVGSFLEGGIWKTLEGLGGAWRGLGKFLSE